MADANLPDQPRDEQSRSDQFLAQLGIDANGHSICTIYPAEASGIKLLTTWITASEGSFVSLEAIR